MEIVIFAILAGYLFFRLWSVLGSRTGYEKQRDPFAERTPPQEEEKDNIIILNPRGSKTEENAAATSPAVAEEIKHLTELDEKFDAYTFLKGAKAAFNIIIKAYTEANHSTLKKLLSPIVYEHFATSIEEREKKNLRQETEIDNLEAEITEIEIANHMAQITVKFTSQQMVATLDDEGNSFDNPARIQVPMIDLWTFEKEISSDTPNWILVRTRSEHA